MVVVQGTRCTIEYAVCADGSMPAKEFIEGLDEQDQRRLVTLFHRLADTGVISNREQFKHLEGKIWEFKRHQVRVGCFQAGARWLLTHGFIKKRNDWPKSEVKRANRIRDEHINREKRRGG